MTNTLLYRFIINTTLGAGMFAYAWMLGYVQMIFSGDVSGVGYAIAAMFLVIFASTTVQVLRVNSERNAHLARPRRPTFEIYHAQKRAAVLQIKQAHLWDAVEWLVLLSLIGNAVGFYISSKGIDVAALTTTEGIVANAGKMLGGVGVAISGTIVGGIACLLTWFNVRMLDTATMLHIEEIR